ncbi:transmembrane protein 72 [Pristis pectinata]|uniref:transmembrane protein 72 n=1 Tax=Pristis pectinata TaxID=685728 RepID=UPI00223D241D|nr:transmembrane protein 72 [Pristis pectinata]
MDAARFWAVLDRTCRILGILTAAVLLGVGIDTAVEGQFTKLAVYLLFAAAVLTILECPYFIDIMLVHRCPYLFQKADNKVWNLWKKALRPNGFQKFLTFIFLSVACFLHPVLIWHATIPGTMLIVSGLAYFVLNLRKKFQVKLPAGSGKARCPQEYATAVILSETGEMEQTYSFQHHSGKKRLALINHMRNIFKLGDERRPASEPTDSTVRNPSRSTMNKGPLFEESAIKVILSEPGDLEETEPEETTSDKVLIIPK